MTVPKYVHLPGKCRPARVPPRFIQMDWRLALILELQLGLTNPAYVAMTTLRRLRDGDRDPIVSGTQIQTIFRRERSKPTGIDQPGSFLSR